MTDWIDKALNLWREAAERREFALIAWQREHGLPAERAAEYEQGKRDWIADEARIVAPHLHHFDADHSDKTPEELRRLAALLSPGGVHTGGLLVRIVGFLANPLLAAAVTYYNWSGGKIGFQFLSDPKRCDLDDYKDEVVDLLEALYEGTDYDPTRILVDDDAAFFASLPDHFTVYRGCVGLTEEQAAAGICWTTRREVADWFANRLSEGDSQIVLTASVRKANVALARASEHEVVVSPRRTRRIKCRPNAALGTINALDRWRAMTWKPTTV